MRVGQLRLAGSCVVRPSQKDGRQFVRRSGRFARLLPTASVRQGYLEASNVNVVKEMVSMISIMRAYETNQKMMQSEDDTTGKAVEEVSKL